MKCIVLLLTLVTCASAQYFFYSSHAPTYAATYGGFAPVFRRKRSVPGDVELESPKRLGWKCILRRLMKRGYPANELDFGYGGLHMVTKREAPAHDLDGAENHFFYHNLALRYPNMHSVYGR